MNFTQQKKLIPSSKKSNLTSHQNHIPEPYCHFCVVIGHMDHIPWCEWENMNESIWMRWFEWYDANDKIQIRWCKLLDAKEKMIVFRQTGCQLRIRLQKHENSKMQQFPLLHLSTTQYNGELNRTHLTPTNSTKSNVWRRLSKADYLTMRPFPSKWWWVNYSFEWEAMRRL